MIKAIVAGHGIRLRVGDTFTAWHKLCDRIISPKHLRNAHRTISNSIRYTRCGKSSYIGNFDRCAR